MKSCLSNKTTVATLMAQEEKKKKKLQGEERKPVKGQRSLQGISKRKGEVPTPGDNADSNRPKLN